MGPALGVEARAEGEFAIGFPEAFAVRATATAGGSCEVALEARAPAERRLRSICEKVPAAGAAEVDGWRDCERVGVTAAGLRRWPGTS